MAARTTKRKFRLKFTSQVGSTDPIWSIAGGTTFNEGSNLSMTVHCNENGAVFSAGEFIDVEFVQQATPAPIGTWTMTPQQMIDNAIAALNAIVTGSVSSAGSQIVRFRMDLLHAAAWDGNFPLVRTSANRPENQGDLSGSWTITNITRGAGSGSITNFTIHDTYTAPPVGLTDFSFAEALTLGGTGTLTVNYGTAANVQLTTNATGVGAAVSTLAFASGGDAGGAFKIVGTQLHSNTALTWNDGLVNKAPYASYLVTLIANGTFTKTFRVRQHMAKISPLPPYTSSVWNGISPDIKVYPNFKNWVTSGVGGNSLVVHPSVIGCTNGGGSSNSAQMRNSGGFQLIRGHKRFIIGSGGSGAIITDLAGSNFTFKDVAFRPGADPPLVELDNRDAFQNLHASYTLHENCSFSWSVDELVQTWGYDPVPKHARYSRCFFHSPLEQAGHAKGNHPFGPISSQGVFDIVYDRCVFLGLNERSPWFYNGASHLLQNCIIARFGANTNGGTFVYMDDVTGGIFGTLPRNPQSEHTITIRGCFYQDFLPNSGTINPLPLGTRLSPVGSRANAIIAANGTGIGPYAWKMYIPEGTDHDNHFFKWTGVNTFNLNPDPITRAGIQYRFNTEDGCLTSYPGFTTDMDSEMMKTGTLALNTATFNDIWQNVGVRYDGAGNSDPGLAGMCQIDYEQWKYFMDTGSWQVSKGAYPNGPPPAAPVPSNVTYDFTKTGLPPGARAWSV